MMYFTTVGVFWGLKQETIMDLLFLSHKYTLILRNIYANHSLHHFDFQILCNALLCLHIICSFESNHLKTY